MARCELSVESNATSIDKRIGRNLQLRRMALQVSRAGLAKALEISPKLLYRYEKGLERMDPDLLVLLKCHLFVDAGWFYEDPDPQNVTRNKK